MEKKKKEFMIRSECVCGRPGAHVLRRSAVVDISIKFVGTWGGRAGKCAAVRRKRKGTNIFFKKRVLLFYSFVNTYEYQANKKIQKRDQKQDFLQIGSRLARRVDVGGGFGRMGENNKVQKWESEGNQKK
jgi:hypothetical protein